MTLLLFPIFLLFSVLFEFLLVLQAVLLIRVQLPVPQWAFLFSEFIWLKFFNCLFILFFLLDFSIRSSYTLRLRSISSTHLSVYFEKLRCISIKGVHRLYGICCFLFCRRFFCSECNFLFLSGLFFSANSFGSSSLIVFSSWNFCLTSLYG